MLEIAARFKFLHAVKFIGRLVMLTFGIYGTKYGERET